MATRTIKSPKFVNGKPTDQVEEIQVEDFGNTSWGPKDKHRLINTRLPRVDSPHKTTGTAIYTHDVRVPGMLHARLVTSPHAHARVTGFDPAAAQRIAGVKAVLPMTDNAGNFQEIRFEGQPIAVVAATTPELAEDAARAVVVRYEVLPHAVTIEEAQKPGAAAVVPGGPGGGARGRGGAGGGTVDAANAAIAGCDAIIEVEYRTPILHHACLETHSAVADFRGGADATVYVSTQGTFTIPNEAQRELGVPVTGIVAHMGGGFGSKLGGIGIAGQWACRLAKQLNTPVKLLLTRREEFLAAGNGPGSVQRVRAGATRDGKIMGMNVTQYSLAGIGGNAVTALPYQYTGGTVFRQASTVNTHENGSVALRAPGHPQACFVMESIVDELAYKIGMDPVEFRKKNLPNNANAQAWVRQLDMGAKAIGWANRNKTPGQLKGPLVRGMGCAIGAWGGGGGNSCQVDVTISQDGSVVVTSGSQDLGTGTRTYVRAIVAEELGLEMSQVLEKIGDSRYGRANGSGGSATAASLAPSVKDAAYKARIEMAKLVAPLLGTDPDGVWFDKGYAIGGGKAITWKQACATVPTAGLAARGAWVQSLASNQAHGATFAEVEVDIETGFVKCTKMCHVQDGGFILNRLAVESQINGGMIQSIGMALYEGRVMDKNLGVMLNPGFNDYKLPGCTEMPEFIPIIDDGDTRNGVIGVAEPANIPGCGAIANAVYNACGVRVRSTPITPDKILMGLLELKKA
jgi:xanthine dehydrogenase YagR molybdenum-binding subunit